MTDVSNGIASRRLDRLEKDMWYGNGKPGITTRVSDLEARVTTLERYNHDRDMKMQRRMNVLIAAICSLAAAVFLQLIFKH